MVVSTLADLGDAVHLGRSTSPSAQRDVLAAVAEVLDPLVPADGGGWIELDIAVGRSSVRSFHHESAPDSEIANGVVATASDHPMVRSLLSETGASDRTPHRLSDLVSATALHRTQAYAKLLKPLEIEQQLFVVTARSSSRAARGWAFNRSRLDFSEREISMMSAIQPLLAIIDQTLTRPAAHPLAADPWGLSPREAEILDHLSAGLTTGAIGYLCGISPRTVRKHLEHAYAKLGVHDKVTAVLRFRSRAEPAGGPTIP